MAFKAFMALDVFMAFNVFIAFNVIMPFKAFMAFKNFIGYKDKHNKEAFMFFLPLFFLTEYCDNYNSLFLQ